VIQSVAVSTPRVPPDLGHPERKDYKKEEGYDGRKEGELEEDEHEHNHKHNCSSAMGTC